MLLKRKLIVSKYVVYINKYVIYTRKKGDRYEWCKYCKYWENESRLCRDIRLLNKTYYTTNSLYNICCDTLSKISKACRSVVYVIKKESNKVQL